ncbi:MAG: hypothetical protein AAB800_04905 [Patescibacteria group bacterium]
MEVVSENLLKALKAAYLTMEDVTSLAEYTRVIEPLLSGIGEDERRQLGQMLWSERERDSFGVTLSGVEPYGYTGLAFHLSPLVGGA